MDSSEPNYCPFQCMNVIRLVITIITQRMAEREVIGFRVTTISTMKEKIIAMAIPWKALFTYALSLGMLVHASLVWKKLFSSAGANSFWSSLNYCHCSISGSTVAAGPNGTIGDLALMVINFIEPSLKPTKVFI
jgi:hypothetical protein